MSAAKLQDWYCQISVFPCANFPFSINDGISIEILKYYATIFTRPPALTAPAGLHDAKTGAARKHAVKMLANPLPKWLCRDRIATVIVTFAATLRR
jgi:hypothetical protein